MMANPMVPPMDPQKMAAMGMPNPFAPPPPPSPSLGFQVWASSPENAHKVQPSMTAPDAPLQPNAGQQMASVNPPAPPPMASAMPPSFDGARAAAQPSAPEPMAMPATSTPSMASVRPPVTTSASPLQLQSAADTAELQRLQNNGAGLNQIHNGFLRGLARVGDVAGTILTPGVMAAVPGTSMHNWQLQHMQQGRVANDQAAQDHDLQMQTNEASLAHTQAETAAIPVNAGMKQQAAAASLAQHGLKVEVDENGLTHVVPDEDSPVFKQGQLKDQLIQSQMDMQQAGVELKNAQTALTASKNDPNSPSYKQAQQRLAVAQQNASAAGQRAQAYMGRYMQSAYNKGMDGSVLPGAAIIGNDEGDQTVVGTGNASLAAKSQANVAQFNDIEGATNNIEQAATKLVGKGGKLNDSRVAAAIADPSSTSMQWAQGQFVNSGLTPEQRDYVIQVKSYKENLQTLRKSAGGGVSDSQVDRLMALAPGASTPDLDYLKRQTEQIRQMRARLASGVTTASGGVKVAGKSNPMKPPTQSTAPAGTQTLTDGGVTYHIPANMVSEFKKDHPNAR